MPRRASGTVDGWFILSRITQGNMKSQLQHLFKEIKNKQQNKVTEKRNRNNKPATKDTNQHTYIQVSINLNTHSWG